MATPLIVPALIGAVTSVAGVASQAEQARKQQRAIDDANKLQAKGLTAAEEANRPVKESLEEMLRLAKLYDPAKDTDIAVGRASEKTKQTLEEALTGLNAQYRSGGGVPGLSTEFNVKAQGMTDRVADPLREFIATQKANEFAKKMAALQMVNGGNAGNLAANFFAASQNSNNLAGSYQPNYGASLSVLSNSLNQLFPNRGGAGGSGDSKKKPFQDLNQSLKAEEDLLKAYQTASSLKNIGWHF